jgi:hypothetical protein
VRCVLEAHVEAAVRRRHHQRGLAFAVRAARVLLVGIISIVTFAKLLLNMIVKMV